MASVALEFLLPAHPDIVKIHIYEGTTVDGAFTQIEEITAIGTYPDYINNYTTNLAISENNWFAISWEDSKGATSVLSVPWKGNTQSVVSMIAERVMGRGTSFSESVVIQEAEGVAERFFHKNPYDVVLPVSYNILNGLAWLVIARLIVLDSTSASSESYSAGLVAQKTSSGSGDRLKFLEWLLKQAYNDLGLSFSMVMELADIDPIGLGTISAVNWDHSRLALTINYD